MSALETALLTCVSEGRLVGAALIGPDRNVVGKWALISTIKPGLPLFGLRTKYEAEVSGVVLAAENIPLATNWFTRTRWMRPVDTMNCFVPLDLSDRVADLYNELAAKLVGATIPEVEKAHKPPEVLEQGPTVPDGVKRLIDL